MKFTFVPTYMRRTLGAAGADAPERRDQWFRAGATGELKPIVSIVQC